MCFERRGTEVVPGCSGEDNLSGKDFCVTKCKDEYCVLHDVGNDIDPGTGHYGKCEVSKNQHTRFEVTLFNYTSAIVLTY